MLGPPEVITGRLMSGAGAAPMLAASAEFTAAAAAYEVSADRLTAQVMYLMTHWQGPTATALQNAATRFLVWMRQLQAQLVASAARTGAQAAAFTTAYTSMAQMAEIVENRVTTATLHATNFLGVNTVPIGVREGQYLEMWQRDVAVQTAYLAETVANTTFEPFLPATPLSGATTFPPTVTQAVHSAMAAGDTARLHADMAGNIAAVLKGQIGLGAGAFGQLASRGRDGAEQAEAQAAVARHREEQLRPTDQMAQQLLTGLPQQLGSLAGQAGAVPQQMMQPVQQAVSQFGSQIGNLLSKVAPEHRVDDPGFFDTAASSTTLDRLAGSGGGAPGVAAVRVPGLGGLSGVSTGFRFPAGWDGAMAPTAPPAASPTTAAGAPRAGAPGVPWHATPRRGNDDTTVRRPDTELIPLWGGGAPTPETVSAGELAGGPSADTEAPRR